MFYISKKEIPRGSMDLQFTLHLNKWPRAYRLKTQKGVTLDDADGPINDDSICAHGSIICSQERAGKILSVSHALVALFGRHATAVT
jgi:hypothetical protein